MPSISGNADDAELRSNAASLLHRSCYVRTAAIGTMKIDHCPNLDRDNHDGGGRHPPE